MADKAFVLGEDTKEIYGYKLTTSDDASTLVYDVGNKMDAVFKGFSEAYGGFELAPTGQEKSGELLTEGPVEEIAITSDGSRIGYIDSDGIIHQHDLTNHFDLTSAWNHRTTNIGALINETPISAYGFTFSTDGNRMFVAIDTRIFQFDLGITNDPTTAVYSGVFFDAANELTADALGRFPAGSDTVVPLAETVKFKLDGTRMYVGDFGGMRLVEYSLSVPYNVSTATPTGNVVDFYAINSSLTALECIEFSHDGQKLITISGGVLFIFKFDTPWDLTTISQVQSTEFYNIDPIDGNQSIKFSADGLKFYISNYSKIVSYNLAAPYVLEVGGVVYDNVSFYVGYQEATPQGITFNNDGTKMYVIGGTSDSVHQYSLSTAFDITTAVYDNVSFYVGGQETSPQGITFNNDGTKMYVIGDLSDSVYQYSLDVPFDVGSIIKRKDVGGQEASPNGITFNNDGTKMYVIGGSSDSVHQYSLSTAFDITTAVYDNVSFYVGGQETSPNDITFNNDGTKMYMIGNGSDSVHQYSLSTAFDITTAVYDNVSFYVGGQDIYPHGITFNNDGTKMYVIGTSSDSVHQYSLSTAFDITTAVYDNVSFNVGGQDPFPLGITFNNDGTKMYVIGGSSDSVHQYSLSTAFDITTAVYDNVSFNVVGQDPDPQGITFNNDGTKMYVNGSGSKSVHQYSLDVPFDVGSIIKRKNVGGQEASPLGITFNNDGTKMYVIGGSSDSVYQYSLSTAFDITTAVYDNVSFNVVGQDTYPRDITFNNDGMKMHVIGESSDSVHQYSLSTAFDITTAVYDNVSFNVGGQDIYPHGITFNNDGTKMYVIGESSDSVYQYSLPLASASILPIEDTAPTSFDFSEDGMNVYVYGSQNGYLSHATLQSPFDLRSATFEQTAYTTEFGVKDFIFKKASGTNCLYFLTTDNKILKGTLTNYGFPLIMIGSEEFTIGAEVTTPKSIEVNDSGSRIYIMDGSNNTGVEYMLPNAFSLNGMYATGDTYTFGEDSSVSSVNYDKSSGTAFMYALGDESDKIYQYEFGGAGSGKFTADITAYDLPTAPTAAFPTSDIPKLSVSFGLNGRSLVCDNVISSVTSVTTTSMTYTEVNGRIPEVGDIFKFYGNGDPVVVAITGATDNGGNSYTITYDTLPFTPDPSVRAPEAIRRIDVLTPASYDLEGSDVVVMNYNKVTGRGRELAFKHEAPKTDTIINMTKFELEKEVVI